MALKLLAILFFSWAFAAQTRRVIERLENLYYQRKRDRALREARR